MAADVRYVKNFLSSSEATASAFCHLGWDIRHTKGETDFWLWVDYGLMEQMDMDIGLLRPAGGWYAQMYIPAVRPELCAFALEVCAQIEQTASLLARIDPDGRILVGMVGDDVKAQLPVLWQTFANPAVYEAILVLCGLSAPPDDEETAPDIDFELMYIDEDWPDERLYRTGYPDKE